MRERHIWVAHWTEDSVDALLRSNAPMVQIRRRTNGQVITEQAVYDSGDLSHLSDAPANAPAAPALELSAVSDDDVYDETPALGGQYGAALFTGMAAADRAVGGVDDPFMWAQRLQDLTDAEALSNLSSRRSHAYGGYGSLGKKGYKGPKKRVSAKARSR